MIGQTLSHYHIVAEISRGGMGVVYRAVDTRLNREVALKVLPPELVADAARRARFVKEAQAASSLEHPHIAVIHEIDEAGGIIFFAMELVRGEKLSDLTARGPLAPGRALDLGAEIAEAMARAHDRGVVHRDLKPANVMLTEDGHSKIIDFGLAKLIDALSGDSGEQTVLRNDTDLYPDHVASRNNLALIYFELDQCARAIPHYEELQRRNVTSPIGHNTLAYCYAAVGRFDSGRRLLDEFLRRNPDSAAGHQGLSLLLAAAGKSEEALAAARRAEALDPGFIFAAVARYDAHMLLGQSVEAETIAQTLSRSSDSFARLVGALAQSCVAFHAGHSVAGLRILETSAAADGPTGSNQTALVRNMAAHALLALGRPAVALRFAERALADARGRDSEWNSLYLIALAQSRLGRASDAQKTIDTLTQKANLLPGDREKRRLQLLAGVMALDRGDTAGAVAALTQAEATLPHLSVAPFPPHVPIWFALGSAHLAAKNDAAAAQRFQRIVDTGSMRIRYPIEFVRSLYLLGQISERQGDRAKANEYYRRFVQYWGNGDIDRDQIADARKRIE